MSTRSFRRVKLGNLTALSLGGGGGGSSGEIGGDVGSVFEGVHLKEGQGGTVPSERQIRQGTSRRLETSRIGLLALQQGLGRFFMIVPGSGEMQFV